MTTRTIPSIPRIACIGECMVELSPADNGLFRQAFADDEQMLFDDESVSDTLGRMRHINEVVVKQGGEGPKVVRLFVQYWVHKRATRTLFLCPQHPSVRSSIRHRQVIHSMEPTLPEECFRF